MTVPFLQIFIDISVIQNRQSPKMQVNWDNVHTYGNETHTLLTKAYGGVVSMSEAVAGYGGGFALIVVLFILLIIVGTAYVGYGY